MPILHILWDDSHIWGILAIRAAKIMDLPLRLVRGRDIAGGLFNKEQPSLLLVPGGNARNKAEGLGLSGLAAVREYIEKGGRYLGFCGGAGLALTAREQEQSLGLCPWLRGGFDERLQHFMSGHLHMSLPGRDRNKCLTGQGKANTQDGEDGVAGIIPDELDESPLLPVWWPGRFAPSPHCGVTVLASYAKPARDFWLADLPISTLPSGTFDAWQSEYGLSLTPSFLDGQPCVIHGHLGKGSYVLSYSHLETPESAQANLWLAHLMRELADLRPSKECIPAWRVRGLAGGQPANIKTFWEDTFFDEMDAAIGEIVAAGLMHGLLFARTDWLLGWRVGIPGAALNNLLAALDVIRSHEPGNAALRFWRERGSGLCQAAHLFSKGCVEYLMAERLAQTLAKFIHDAVPVALLKKRRESLFGPPMRAAGLYRELMEPLDELAFLQISE